MEIIDKVLDWNNINLYEFLYEEDNIPLGWEEFFNDSIVSKEIKTISDYIEGRIREEGNGVINKVIVYPEITNTFRLFRYLKPKNIKVFLCGQDPYHNKGSAIGMAFSVGGNKEGENNNTINPSLVNIYKKVESELYPEGKYFTDSTYKIRTCKANGNITPWVNQGVFLINTALTVEEGKANSHKHIWKNFSNLLLKYLCKFFSKNDISVIWVLMGRESHNFANDIVYSNLYKIDGYIPGEGEIRNAALYKGLKEKECKRFPCVNKIICCSHPSPLGMDKNCGIYSSFKDTAIFNTINDTLKIWKKKEIIF